MQETEERPPESSATALHRYGPLLLLLALCLAAPLHFFETFPNGWDQTEYAWCVKEGLLPHSPYVLFLFLGRLLALVLPPAVALSSLSLVSGLVALVLLHQLVVYLDDTGDTEPTRHPRMAALAAALLLGASTVFVRHVATQEVYALQLCLLLACATVLASESRFRVGAGGVLYGCALAAHNASVFALPALLVLAARKGAGRDATVRARSVGIWLVGAGATLAVAYGVTAILLPAAPGERLAEVWLYLRGMPPGLHLAALLEPGFLAESAAGMATRLTAGEIDVTRGPLATGPVGLGFVHGIVAAAGLVWLGRRKPAAAAFLSLWALPFLLYELTLGWNLDYGIYLVFVLPPVCAACGIATGWLGASRRLRPKALSTAAALLMLALLLAPSATQLSRHWDDIARDRQRHDSPTTLAAVFAASALPENAVVVQPRSEWNANLLPFHAERRHVARIGTTLKLLRSRAPFTPMKPEAYDLLTTERLTELVRAGVPVIAFEPQPLRGANVGALDASRFVWRPVGNAELAIAAERLGLSERRRSQLAGRTVPMVRAELAAGR